MFIKAAISVFIVSGRSVSAVDNILLNAGLVYMVISLRFGVLDVLTVVCERDSISSKYANAFEASSTTFSPSAVSRTPR